MLSMTEEPIKFTLQDIDAAPLNPNTQPIIDEEVSLKLSRYQRIIENNDKYYELKEHNSQLQSRLNSKDELDKLIKPFANRAFGFMCAYCTFVGLILILHGFKICGFGLDNIVLQIVVGSTAVTVIGLVGMVLTGVFVGARKH